MSERVQMVIGFNLPRTYGKKEIKDYIRDAVNNWGGQFHPDDELFNFPWELKLGPLTFEEKTETSLSATAQP